MKSYKEFGNSKKIPGKKEVKIGDKFVINSGDEYVFKRYITEEEIENNQILSDGTKLEHMLNKQFSYYKPKIGEILEIVDLEKSLTPGHSDSKQFTIKIGDNYYSTEWKSIKDMIR